MIPFCVKHFRLTGQGWVGGVYVTVLMVKVSVVLDDKFLICRTKEILGDGWTVKIYTMTEGPLSQTKKLRNSDDDMNLRIV